MSCLIHVDNYQEQYRPGDAIIGRVVCCFLKAEDIRGIVLKLKGKEENEWEDEIGKNRTSHRACNKFLRLVKNLHNGGVVGPGMFEYPFTIHLPGVIPSTYKGRYGGVSYYLKVKVDKPITADYANKDIIVFAPINFNLIKNRLQLKPVDHSIDKVLCTLFWNSNTITMDVHLAKTAFVVGEVVNVKVDINNMSSQCVKRVGVELGMDVQSMITFVDFIGTKTDYEVLASQRGLGVGAHRQKKYNFNMMIPYSAQVPSFSLCKLFSQKTILKITAPIDSLFHRAMVMELDITLGHIPVGSPSALGEQYPSNTSPPNTCPPKPYPPNSNPPNPIVPRYPPVQNPVPCPNGYVTPERADGVPSAPPPEDGASTVEEAPPPSYNEVMDSNKGGRTHFANAD